MAELNIEEHEGTDDNKNKNTHKTGRCIANCFEESNKKKKIITGERSGKKPAGETKTDKKETHNTKAGGRAADFLAATKKADTQEKS